MARVVSRMEGTIWAKTTYLQSKQCGRPLNVSRDNIVSSRRKSFLSGFRPPFTAHVRLNE